MKILIVWIAQFVGHNGGMDKVFVRFANEMVRRGHTMTLAYCTEHSGKSYTPIDPQVHVVNISTYLPDGKWESLRSTSFKLKREFLRLFSKSYMFDYTRKYESQFLQPSIRKLLNEIKPDIIVTMDARTTAAIKFRGDRQRICVLLLL